MRVRYSPNPYLYDEYYSQSGGGYPVYVGGMRGSGLGSVLSGLFRSAIPLLKQGGKALLKEGINSGLHIAQDVLDGKNFKKSLKQQSRKTGNRLLKRAIGQFKRPAAPPGEPAVKRIKYTNQRKKRLDAPKDIFG